jgi:hypothetical protein
VSRFTTRPRPAAFECANCGPLGTRHCAHGLCRACADYRYRKGQDRPPRLYVGGPRRCITCGDRVPPTAGRRCHACQFYRRYHHGAERPAALYQRRRCGECAHYLPQGAPAYQTLCRACAGRWNAAVNAREARTA